MGRMHAIFLGVAAFVLLGMGFTGYIYDVRPGAFEYNTYLILGAVCLAAMFLVLGWKEELVPLVIAAVAFDRSWLFWLFLVILIFMLYMRRADCSKAPDKGSSELPVSNSGRLR